ncbi:uncharacterized protein L969DRAFT_18592 [Mixia osmundae IAM 14324]|uniref:uncharacterized protein n=1 Tax=Mixia osmundae (strain CBS 9802 / IAM 14324 / JCM 22182 / KY 12970) TaxID=764103 RepID=UPI0004A54DBC|nr:uncharacterized protein L969DRAFT_18592 [Mixia osmundae IAM 14324]KEI38576.1 hypothetical protein L969DRAFT_18592 [Mixia osmundae IAM 14324]
MRGLRDLSPDSTLLGSLRILTSSSGKTAVSQDPDAADHTDESMRRTRLPTLREVLSRQTKAPVDLYCFYIYLQRENNVDVLDFWLDVQQHESLFRTYLKDLARQTVTSPRMTSETQHRDSSAQDPAPTSPRLAELSPDQSSRIRQALQRDWPAYLRYAQQNGSCYESLLGPLYQGNPEKDAHTKEQALAGLGIGHAPQPASGLYVEALREGYAGSTPAIRVESDDQTARDVTLARQPSQLTSQSATTMGRQASRSSVMSQTLRALYPDEANATNEPIHNHSERLQRSPSRAASRFSAFSTASSRLMRSGSICKSKTPVQPKIYRNAALTREDIIVSAERIYARYLLRGAEREIYLPEYLKVAALPSVDPDDGDSDAGGRLPDLFHKQKA